VADDRETGAVVKPLMTPPADRTTLLLGAAGLIGQYLTADLRHRGFRVIAVARRFPAPRRGKGDDLELPIAAMPAEALADLIRTRGADVIVNCLGVLQDGPGSDTRTVHVGFVERVLGAIRDSGRDVCLVHVSMPGRDGDDRTPFSRTKRDAERLIRSSDVRHVILRPGFVIAPAAFGGSALMRALAVLPFALGTDETSKPFAPVAIEDIAETVATIIAEPATTSERPTWELMQRDPATLGDVIGYFRALLGGPKPLVTIPSALLTIGARFGDAASWLGWSPPIRTTALAELRRGVAGDPQQWIAATGIAPRSLADLAAKPATIQDKWFARLYLVKALIIAALAIFWIASGLIALTVSFDAAANILTAHGFPPALVGPATAASSLMDIAIGVAIAIRRSCKVGLIAGIAASLFYMIGAAVLTPDIWLEPLGALVKTFPVIVLMLVALLILDDR
jgi:uncharacterized protein YbjT (DUF2867 family)